MEAFPRGKKKGLFKFTAISLVLAFILMISPVNAMALSITDLASRLSTKEKTVMVFILDNDTYTANGEMITDEKASIVMSFTAPNANILFTQTSITDKFSSSVNVDAQQAKTKKVQIDKYEGNLITFEDGSANLLWITDDHLMCQIFGDISSDQATEMANSIK